MIKKVNSVKKAIQPVYKTSQPNKPILLHEGTGLFTDSKGSEKNTDYKLTWQWLPHPKIFCELQPSYDELGNRYQLSSSEVKFSNGLGVGYGKIIVGSAEYGDSSNLHYLIFHLTNFAEYMIGDLVLESPDWKITVSSLKGINDGNKGLWRKIKESGGYGITHVGKLEKINNSTFSANEATEVLSALSFFLSFANGTWSSPVFLVGFDRSKKKVWKKWRADTIDPYDSYRFWMPIQNPSQINEAWCNFELLWQDNDWQDALRIAIHLYLSANIEKVPDLSIALTQMALELLTARVNFIVGKWTIAPYQDKKDRAAFKIREMLKDKSIDIAIPKELSKLTPVAKVKSWDGPDAFVKLRNWMVHPSLPNRKDHKSIDVMARYDARELGLWYLELVLLHLLCYTGKYRSRIKHLNVLESELVPWVPRTTKK